MLSAIDIIEKTLGKKSFKGTISEIIHNEFKEIKMKSLSLIVLLVLLIGGCCHTEFYPATTKAFLPKEPNSTFDFLMEQQPNYSAQPIGQLFVSSSSILISPENLRNEFVKEGKKRGADGAAGINYKNIQSLGVIPGGTTYEPINSSTTGNISGDISANYSSTSTTWIPVREPDYYYNIQTKVISGMLFIRQ